MHIYNLNLPVLSYIIHCWQYIHTWKMSEKQYLIVVKYKWNNSYKLSCKTYRSHSINGLYLFYLCVILWVVKNHQFHSEVKIVFTIYKEMKTTKSLWNMFNIFSLNDQLGMTTRGSTWERQGNNAYNTDPRETESLHDPLGTSKSGLQKLWASALSEVRISNTSKRCEKSSLVHLNTRSQSDEGKNNLWWGQPYHTGTPVTWQNAHNLFVGMLR